MSERGTLLDTYVAALQHDLVELPAGTTRVGVVRRPTPWFHAAVDENRPVLAPPEALLDDAAKAQDDLEADGLAEARAQREAWGRVGFRERYLAHLDDSEEADATIEELVERIADGEDVALVCFENTDEKRCHRTPLRERIEQRL